MGRSFQHPLGEVELPIRVTSQELEILVPQLKAGCKKAYERIINGHIGLAMSIAGRYGGSRIDDIVSEALLGLTQAVKWVEEGRLKDNNISPYINTTIYSFINTFLRKDTMIYIPKHVGKKYIFKQMEYTKDDVYITDHPKTVKTRIDEIKTCLNEIIKDKTEKTIIEYRSQGYRDKEIESKVFMTTSRISQIMIDVERRFNNRWEAENVT